VPLIYVDRSLEGWYRAVAASVNGDAASVTEVGSDPGGASETQALVLGWRSQNQGLATNAHADMRYSRMRETGQKLARFDFNWDAARTDSTFEIRTLVRTDGGAGTQVYSATFSTAGGSPTALVVVTDFTNGRNEWDLRVVYTGGGGTTASDSYWLSVIENDVYTVAMRYDADGTEKTTGYTVDTVLASDVVKDLLGRLLTKYDGAGATVDTTTFAYPHLAYPDPVTPAQILEDLMAMEPDFYWAAWESNSDDKHRFEWRTWPTTIRYEADVTDGFDSPGSLSELYNNVTVRWKDATGRIKRTQRTQIVAVLDDAGLTREAAIDLGDNIGSSSAATQAGDEFLTEHGTAPNRGTLTVAHPILDKDTGRMVQPWEIRPGHLIRVRGVLPSIDALNATARDGVTVFRIVSTEFRASDVSAVLELDAAKRSIAAEVADLSRRRFTRRR
jgi:hypothetical protein